MKNKKVLIIGGLIVLFVVFLIWKNRKGSTAYSTGKTTAGTNTSTASTGGSTNSSTSPSGCTNTTVLKKGSDCDRVQWSQYKINQVASMLGIATLSQDSKFGSKTEAGFQKLLGRKTGTWNEVNAKVNSMLHDALGVNTSSGDGWYFADGTPFN